MKTTELITIADACVTLSVSRKTLYRMIVAGALPAPKRVAGFRQLYFDRHAFDAAVRKALR
ncbi:MAG TPA: helix-turn-helix domain-containing protein [Gemmatimonadales bacterium]|nr:helix-turn-helix domain-containing protein [Gemmatimonadales bacterium]